jgi:hypothetical protein
MSGSGNPSGDENDLDLKEQDRFLPIAKWVTCDVGCASWTSSIFQTTRNTLCFWRRRTVMVAITLIKHVFRL